MIRPTCDLFNTEKKRRAIWVRLDNNQFKELEQIAKKEKLTLGQMVKKDLLIKLEVKKGMTEQANKVFDMLRNPTPQQHPSVPSSDCA